MEIWGLCDWSLWKGGVGRRGSEQLLPPWPDPSLLFGLTPQLSGLGNPSYAASLVRKDQFFFCGSKWWEILPPSSLPPLAHLPSGLIYQSPLSPAPTYTPTGDGHENFDSAPPKPDMKHQSMLMKATYGCLLSLFQGPLILILNLTSPHPKKPLALFCDCFSVHSKFLPSQHWPRSLFWYVRGHPEFHSNCIGVDLDTGRDSNTVYPEFCWDCFCTHLEFISNSY